MMKSMKVDLGKLTLRLESGGSLKLRDARGLSIRALRGVLWITQEGDLKDHTLGLAERFEVSSRGLVIITAVTQAELRVEPSAKEAGKARPAPLALVRSLPASG
jgi:hypothetical protein